YAVGQSITVGGSAANATSFTTTAPVYFTANVGNTPGSITRTTGDWIADGYAVGQTINVTGSAANSGVLFTITGVTHSVITLSQSDKITTEATAGTPESVTIHHNGTYQITNV